MNEEGDLAEYNFHFTFGLEVRQSMGRRRARFGLAETLPVDDAMCYTDPLEEEDKAWFESFPDPTWCLSKLQEARNLEEKAAAYGIEMVRVIDWLRDWWKSGYQIYADIDPFEDDEWN